MDEANLVGSLVDHCTEDMTTEYRIIRCSD